MDITWKDEGKMNKNKGFKSTISTKTKKQKKLSHLSSSRILPLFSGEKKS